MNEIPTPSKRSSPVRLNIIFCVFFGLFAIWDFYVAISHDYRFVFFGVLYLSVSLVLLFAARQRFGWTIPCLILGIMLGYFLDPPVKHGPHMAHIEETIFIISFWTIFGLGAGITMDAISYQRIKQQEQDMQ